MQSHASDLRAEVDDRSPEKADALVHAVVHDWRTADLSSRDALLMAHAEKLTRQPATMNSEDVQRLRDAGWDDVAIHDATQIIAYFNYINRIADGLGVELDEGARIWGRA